MPDFHDHDDQYGILNLVEDSVVALADSIPLASAGEFFDAGWAWIVSERANPADDALAVLFRSE